MTQLDDSASPNSVATIGQMADLLDEALLLTDGSGVVLSANAAARQLFNDHIIGQLIFELIEDADFGRGHEKLSAGYPA